MLCMQIQVWTGERPSGEGPQAVRLVRGVGVGGGSGWRAGRGCCGRGAGGAGAAAGRAEWSGEGAGFGGGGRGGRALEGKARSLQQSVGERCRLTIPAALCLGWRGPAGSPRPQRCGPGAQRLDPCGLVPGKPQRFGRWGESRSFLTAAGRPGQARSEAGPLRPAGRRPRPRALGLSSSRMG